MANKDKQKFGLLDKDNKYIITLNDRGEYTSGTIEEAAKLNIIQLEEWLAIIKSNKIVYKVIAIPIQYI